MISDYLSLSRNCHFNLNKQVNNIVGNSTAPETSTVKALAFLQLLCSYLILSLHEKQKEIKQNGKNVKIKIHFKIFFLKKIQCYWNILLRIRFCTFRRSAQTRHFENYYVGGCGAQTWQTYLVTFLFEHPLIYYKLNFYCKLCRLMTNIIVECKLENFWI